MKAQSMRRADGLWPCGWGRLFLGIAHMIRHPKHHGNIDDPIAQEAAAVLVQALGHRYGAEWIIEAAYNLGDEPPDVAPPIPDAIPISRERRTA